MRFWPRKKKPAEFDSARLAKALRAIPVITQSRTDIRQQWIDFAEHIAGASYFVDGKRVEWADVRAAIDDGATHHISVIYGEAGPEVATFPTDPKETP